MIDWGKLYSQNRVKYPGVPWSKEELKAVYELHIPAAYVRQGALTKEEYDKMRKEQLKTPADFPIDESREKLFKIAKDLKIDFVPTIRDDDLIRLIQEKKRKLEEIEKSQKKIEEETIKKYGNKKTTNSRKKKSQKGKKST